MVGHFGSKAIAIGHFGSKLSAIGHFDSWIGRITYLYIDQHNIIHPYVRSYRNLTILQGAYFHHSISQQIGSLCPRVNKYSNIRERIYIYNLDFSICVTVFKLPMSISKIESPSLPQS